MSSGPKVPIQSTAGAILVKNEKGQLVTEKVKVQRYVSGKRPDYAPESSDEEDFELVNLERPERSHDRKERAQIRRTVREEAEDRTARSDEEDEEERETRMRRTKRVVTEPELLERSDTEEDLVPVEPVRERLPVSSDSEEEEEELSEEEIERRRQALRQRARKQQQEEEILAVEEEKAGSDEESSEYESEYESEEEEEEGPRLRPVFVRKKDRVTIQEKEREKRREQEQEKEAQRLAEDRRRQTLQMVENAVKHELEQERAAEDDLTVVDTDDENVEEEYENWKVRELRRMKRDREERETLEKEKSEIDSVRNMTEEERRKWFKEHPKEIINKAQKGKYRFLQKYYHRGAFFMDQEEGVYSRDYSLPTLEDHFDKTVLPKVMQVKNFGRSGRTKYTHLVDQDTTQFDSPWIADTAANLKFHTSKGGGAKQTFDRPSTKKKN